MPVQPLQPYAALKRMRMAGFLALQLIGGCFCLQGARRGALGPAAGHA